MSNEKKLLAEIERERQVRALEQYLKTGHAPPKTRREFLASGLKAMAATMYMPSILQLLSSHAYAQAVGCSPAAVNGLAPVVSLNLAGGAALPANCLPLLISGGKLNTYSKLGMGSPANWGAMQTEFGGVEFPTYSDGALISKFLEGVREQANTAVNNTAWVQVCCTSQDDSSSNELNISGLVQAAGLNGSLLPNLGTEQTRTGVRQQPAFKSPGPPLIVENFTTIQKAVLPDDIISNMGATRRNKLLSLVKTLSSQQRRTLASSGSPDTLGRLVECATGKNLELAENTNIGLDPNSSPIAGFWNLGDGNQRKIAAMVYAALQKKAGAVNIEFGSYDYHNGGRTGNDDMDRNAGRFVGRVLASAQAMNTKVFIHVTTDGSVYSDESATPGGGWQGDNASGGMSYILAFDPAGRPAMKTTPDRAGNQIGGFNQGQGADDSFLTRWSTERSALAVFANYLEFSGRMDLFNGLQSGEWNADQLAKVLKFAKV